MVQWHAVTAFVLIELGAGQASGLPQWDPPTGLRAVLAPSGVEFTMGEGNDSWSVAMVLEEWGRSGALRPAGAAGRVATESYVEFERGGLGEWYLCDPRGIEQGFTIAERPDGSGSSVIEIRFALDGTLSPELDAARRDLVFRDSSGASVRRTSSRRSPVFGPRRPSCLPATVPMLTRSASPWRSGARRRCVGP